MRRAPEVRLHRTDRSALAEFAASPSTPPRVALRARAILRAADGAENLAIARELGRSPATVARWRHRYLIQGLAGVTADAPRPGRPPVIPDATIRSIVRATLSRPPPRGRYWTVRGLAREVGVSKSSIHRIWRSQRLDPRRSSSPPPPSGGLGFLDRVTDMVGLYLNPPERAIAFSTDERARGSILGRGQRRAIAGVRRRSEGAELRAFLQTIDRETPKALDLHLLVDSRLVPSSPELQQWLTRHPRIYLHYLPSDQLGQTLIDRLVAEFSKKRVRPDTFPSVQRLHRALREHLRSTQAVPRPFVWAAPAQEIRGRFGRPELPTGINGTIRKPRPPAAPTEPPA